MNETDQAVANWLSEAERVKASVKGFRWPDEMSFAEAVLYEINRLRGLNHLSEVFRIVEGVTRADFDKVNRYARLLADKLEEDGETNSARWLRRILDGKAGARIVAHNVKTEPEACGGYYCSEEYGHIDCAKRPPVC